MSNGTNSFELNVTEKIEGIGGGDIVRSFNGMMPKFDFELTGPNASYVEGVVLGITVDPIEGCRRYAIRVLVDQPRGDDRETQGKATIYCDRSGRTVYPPVNGTWSMSNPNGTIGVQKIDKMGRHVDRCELVGVDLA